MNTVQTVLVLQKIWKYLQVTHLGIGLLQCSLHILQPPMLRSIRQVPIAPQPEQRGRAAPARKRVLRVCYFCCPIASTWVPQGRLFIMLPRQVVRRGGGVWSVRHHHGDSASTASVKRPPGSVTNRTLGCPLGLMGSLFPAGQWPACPAVWPDAVFLNILFVLIIFCISLVILHYYYMCILPCSFLLTWHAGTHCTVEEWMNVGTFYFPHISP